eukprot:350447-Chlamydomonas_euryale.AAC.2
MQPKVITAADGMTAHVHTIIAAGKRPSLRLQSMPTAGLPNTQDSWRWLQGHPHSLNSTSNSHHVVLCGAPTPLPQVGCPPDWPNILSAQRTGLLLRVQHLAKHGR